MLELKKSIYICHSSIFFSPILSTFCPPPLNFIHHKQKLSIMSSNPDQSDDVLQIVEAAHYQDLQNQQKQQTEEIEPDKHSNQEQIDLENHESKEENGIKQLEKTQTKIEIKSPKKKSKKVILYKCKICKTTGKRSTVKMCSKCKFHFHIECLDPDKIVEQSKTFVCQLCEKSPQTTISTNQINLRPKINEKQFNKDPILKSNDIFQQKEKSNSGFLNISKLATLYQANFKKQEWKRKLYEFYQKYPYCFQRNRVIFPIEDHLLHIYQSIFPSYCKTTTPRPKPSFPNEGIPEQFYNDLMEIEVFFANFWEDLKLHNFFMPICRKQDNEKMKPGQLKRKNIYEKFLPSGMTELYAWILETLLRMYLNDIMDRNRIDNMKFISSNAFFNLLATINEDEKGLAKEFVLKLAPEIIKNLTKAPSFKHSFYSQFDGQDAHQLHYPKNLSIKDKIIVITKLIRGLCDTDCFKEIVTKKSEMIGILTKQKGENLLKLKAIENQNIPLRQKIKELEKQLKQLAFSDPKQYSKKYESSTKKLEKLIVQHKVNLKQIEEFRQKVKEIARKMPFVNSAVKFLGVDRFRSEYFFYKHEKTRIYVKYRESLLGEDTNSTFMCYQSKEEVQKLKSWLNAKGVNQKGLLFNINSLEQKDLLNFSSVQKDPSEVLHTSPQNPIIIEEQKRLQFIESVTRQQNLQSLVFCQHLYKDTLQNAQILQIREQQMSDLFEKLSLPYSIQKFNQNQTKNDQLIQENSLKILFSKYSIKLWNWNQKVKKFWFQFLDMYTTESHHQTEGNLMILASVWKIAVRLHHEQMMRKRQKQEKKRQKEKNMRQKEMDSFMQQNFEMDQPTSSHEQNSTSYIPDDNDKRGRRLRKRQGKIIIGQKDSESPQNSINDSSKKQTSSPEQSIKQQKKSESKSLTKKRNQIENKKEKKISGKNAKENETKKGNTKKLLIESSSSSLPDQQSEEFPSQQINDEGIQKQLKKMQQQNLLLDGFSEQQVSPEEEFCEECFENVNYDKGSKIKTVRCGLCSKIYHKKCLDEEDASRLKKQSQNWKCDDCYKNKDTSQNNKSLNNGKIKANQTVKKVTIDEKQQKIIFQTVHIQENQLTRKANTKDALKNHTNNTSNTKSKVSQKAEKIKRKNIEEESKIESQEFNSQSFEEEQEEATYEPYNVKNKRRNGGKPVKHVKRETPKKSNNKQKQRSKNQKGAAQSVNNSLSSSQRRSMRNKSNRKRIVEQSSSEQEPNSEQYSEQLV